MDVGSRAAAEADIAEAADDEFALSASAPNGDGTSRNSRYVCQRGLRCETGCSAQSSALADAPCAPLRV